MRGDREVREGDVRTGARGERELCYAAVFEVMRKRPWAKEYRQLLETLVKMDSSLAFRNSAALHILIFRVLNNLTGLFGETVGCVKSLSKDEETGALRCYITSLRSLISIFRPLLWTLSQVHFTTRSVMTPCKFAFTHLLLPTWSVKAELSEATKGLAETVLHFLLHSQFSSLLQPVSSPLKSSSFL